MTFMTLPQRIEVEQGKRGPSEIRELNLNHSKSSTIEGLSEEYSNLEVLSLSNVGLEDLSGLPKLQSLKVLELSNNSISGGLEALLNCPKLEQLNLSSNKIGSVDALLPLAKLSSLRNLELFNCNIAATENYRKAVFAALPNLKFLDGLDENNEEEPVSGVLNGDAEDANGGENPEEDDEEDSEDEEDEEEYGLEVLQRSGELEDDDEDYAPGEEEDADLGEYDDDEEEDEEEEEDIEDDGANLSGAGVTGPRRPGSKRPHGDLQDVEAPSVKQKATEEAESHVNNGASVE